MKKWKRVFSALLACCLVMLLLPTDTRAANTVSGTCGGEGDGSNLTWTLDLNTGALVISGRGAMANYTFTSTSAPWYSYRSSMTSLTIGSGVTSIGDYAFYNCSGFTGSLTIPDSVTSIGDSAFCGCSGFTGSLTIPDSVTSIGDWAFSLCRGFTGSLTIPDGVTSIGEDAFSYCSGFTGSLTISDSVTFIGKSAFYECSGFTGSLTIPDGVTSIGRWTFYKCSGFTGSLSIGDSVTSIDYNAFLECSGFTGSLTIGDSVTSIGDSAFCGCSGFTGSLTIPDSVTSIDAYAFYKCSGFTGSLTIGDSVTLIGGSAFDGCSGFTGAYFRGDAPTAAGTDTDYPSFPTDLTLYYVEGRSGWTSPTWEGYQTATWNGILPQESARPASTQTNGSNPEASNLYILGLSDWNIAFDGINSKVKAVFNKNIVKGSGRITIRDVRTGGLISYPISDDSISINQNVLSIDLQDWGLYGGHTYYVTIESGAIKATDGTVFYGLTDKNAWVLTVQRDLSVTGITMKWAKSGWWIFESDDYSKPPIPAGTDKEYANLLIKWAANFDIMLSDNEALALLSQNVSLPVTDVNGSTVLLNDGTTVRQVIEDIVFVANLQEYIYDIDRELSNVEKYSSLSTLMLDQEQDIYREVIGWYDQIHSYISGRGGAGPSNFFYAVAAPTAYTALTKLIESSTDSYYQFIKPFLSATMDQVEYEASINSLNAANNYNTFKQKAEVLQTTVSGGKAIYTAKTGDGYGGVVKFGADLLRQYFGSTDNALLNEISESYSQLSSATSAVKISMLLGSTVGMFPLVVDLYNSLFTKIDDSVKTLYFIGDYYIYDQYPGLYNIMYDEETGAPDSANWGLASQYAEAIDNNAILYNWMEYVTKIAAYEYRSDEFVTLRRDLTNYALLLRYVKSVDTDETIRGLVQYISALQHQQATTTLYTKCPVQVNIYDSETQELLASLSSEDEEIQDWEYGSLYLTGEDNETKCFVLSSGDYYAEIVPYDEGTMDVMVLNTDTDGTVSETYYEQVELSTDAVFYMDSLSDGSLKRTAAGDTTSISATDVVPVTGIVLTGSKELAVGSSAMLAAQVQPVVATNQSVNWSSSDESILTVDEYGTVTALSEGSAIITATSEDGVSASLSVSVYVPAASIDAAVESISMCSGEKYVATVTVGGDHTHAVSWSSSDLSVVSVDSDGVLYAQSAGSAVVTAEIDGLTADILVTVSEELLTATLYQSDTDGMRLKVDLTNASCVQDFEGAVYVAIYENSRMIGVQCVASSLAHGKTVTVYYPLDKMSMGNVYTASAFVLDEDGIPSQQKVNINILI